MTTSHLITGKVRDRIRPGTEVAGGFFRMCVLTGKAMMEPFSGMSASCSPGSS